MLVKMHGIRAASGPGRRIPVWNESVGETMVVIGIETSGLSGSVALVHDGVCLESRSLDQPGRRHAQSLILELRDLLDAHRLSPRGVHAVTVSRGPGSFTGLRVGLVCAKTFAYATGCRFAAVDTFSAVAMNCPVDISETWIVEDAQRGDLVVGKYRRDHHHWVRSGVLEIVCAEQWLPTRTADEVIIGRGLLRCDISSIQARCLIDAELILPKAWNIALAGERMLQNQGCFPDADFDFWKAGPFYMRPSAAEEVRDQRDAGKLGK